MTLLIDIGGTNTRLYRYDPRRSTLVFVSKQMSPHAYINEFISQLLEKSSALINMDQVLIGIPGPVSSSSTIVFCPPLNQYVHISQYGKNIKFVNDTVIQAALLPLSACTRTTLLATVGTSLGFCIISPDFYLNFNPNKVKPHELAHLTVDELNLNDNYTSEAQKIIGDDRLPLYKIYSMGGFAMCCGLTTTLDRFGMIRVTDDEIAYGLLSGKINTKNITEFRRSLGNTIKTYAATLGIESSTYDTYIRGGFYEALHSSPLWTKPVASEDSSQGVKHQ